MAGQAQRRLHQNFVLLVVSDRQHHPRRFAKSVINGAMRISYPPVCTLEALVAMFAQSAERDRGHVGYELHGGPAPSLCVGNELDDFPKSQVPL